VLARIASRLVTSTTNESGSSPQPAPLPEGTDWLALNRANWDARVPIHAASRFYDVPGFVAGRSTLRDFELTEVGDVSGRTLLHLQCHIGPDTLSWARLGATVTGLDFSGPALETARSIAEQIGVTDARFVESDVYEAATALEGRPSTSSTPASARCAGCPTSSAGPGPPRRSWLRAGSSTSPSSTPSPTSSPTTARPWSSTTSAPSRATWTEGETYTDYTAEPR
jgi:hypothetical protein